MKTTLKELAIFTYEMIFFMIISVPLAMSLYTVATLMSEIKNLTKWITK